MVMLHSLVEIPASHPFLFGESEVIPPAPLIIEEGATVIPGHFNNRERKDWAIHFSQGAFNANGDHIEASNDMRGNRKHFSRLRVLKTLLTPT